MKRTAACFVCLMVLVSAMPVRAADTSYLGTWKLTEAVAAPWADAKQKPDAAEKTRLIGRSVVLGPKAITGPKPFACTAPHYKVSSFATDMIFQGALGEMQSTSKAADSNKIAASLGFSGASIRTLETGCEIDFHFVDATTAQISLNNYVYTLKKQ